MSAVIRRLRLATAVRQLVISVGRITSYKPLIASIGLLCVASVFLTIMSQNDVTAGDTVALDQADKSGIDVDGALPTVRQNNDRLSPQPLFIERPLVFLTLSYHAAPIYDLMDQLQPLGVKFIERGINAYACRYFNTCRQDGLLEAWLSQHNIHNGAYLEVCKLMLRHRNIQTSFIGRFPNFVQV